MRNVLAGVLEFLLDDVPVGVASHAIGLADRALQLRRAAEDQANLPAQQIDELHVTRRVDLRQQDQARRDQVAAVEAGLVGHLQRPRRGRIQPVEPSGRRGEAEPGAGVHR